ncbi:MULTISPECIES: MFS transporter [unclassified Streptomyces]|uniref:MFS transporter n=1 Tax=unclassified Streptomyces TaxID=2593676 RepID=UPI003BB5CA2D
MSTRARWAGVLSLLVIVLISYVDRVNVSVLITDKAFTDHFGITGDPTAQGALSTVFLVGYGIAAFVLTPFYETSLGVRRGLVVSVALWSLMTLLSPYALGALTLTVLRALLGAAEGPLFSLKTMYVREHFEPHEAGRPNAVSSMGVSLGTAAGLPLITYLVYRFDWHTSFIALAALNAVVGLPLILLFVRGRGVRGAERPGFGATLKGALRMPRLAPILVIEIATLAYLWGSSAWLPSYLLRERHFSLSAMGIVSALPFLMSLVSGFLGGLVLDRLPRRLLALPFVVGSAGTAVCVLLVAGADSDAAAATGLILAGGFWGLQGPAIPTLVQHCAPARFVGSAYGVVNGVGNLVSAFMPTLMGVAIAASGGHGFGAGFGLLAGAQALTLVCGAWLLVRPIREAPAAESDAARLART